MRFARLLLGVSVSTVKGAKHHIDLPSIAIA